MYIVADDRYYEVAKFVLDKFDDVETDIESIEIDVDYIEHPMYGSTEQLSNKIFITLSDNLLEEDLTKTLIHEMVHAVQFMRGDLIFKSKTKLWKGEDHSDTNYNEQPWEIEAYYYEEKLYEEFKCTLK